MQKWREKAWGILPSDHGIDGISCHASILQAMYKTNLTTFILCHCLWGQGINVLMIVLLDGGVTVQTGSRVKSKMVLVGQKDNTFTIKGPLTLSHP